MNGCVCVTKETHYYQSRSGVAMFIEGVFHFEILLPDFSKSITNYVFILNYWLKLF